jgi:hypothetical protein
MWQSVVDRTIKGKRGQAFLRECLAALDALPEKRLVAGELVSEEGCCAMGAVALARGMDVRNVDADNRRQVADAFGITPSLASEIAYVNDDDAYYLPDETPEQRFERVRKWVASRIVEDI